MCGSFAEWRNRPANCWLAGWLAGCLAGDLVGPPIPELLIPKVCVTMAGWQAARFHYQNAAGRRRGRSGLDDALAMRQRARPAGRRLQTARTGGMLTGRPPVCILGIDGIAQNPDC